ncbi:alpha/beta hydrolase [Longimicrobium sp.]|uniref:alpha/beta hydrolase n=1 Tax=Longimicrobium sp. TaxID=2029185 RepID=UPI003B3B63A3
MARQVLFVHGGGGGAYAADAKLVESLRARLGGDYVVRYPELPNEEEPQYEVWKNAIAGELAAMGSGAILVGHSIGGSVIIRAVVDGDIGHSLAGVLLLSAPFWYEHDFWRWDEVKLPADAAERIPDGLPVFVVHGTQDESVPFAHAEMYARALPQATLRPLDGRDHQLGEDLTEVARDIMLLR